MARLLLSLISILLTSSPHCLGKDPASTRNGGARTDAAITRTVSAPGVCPPVVTLDITVPTNTCFQTIVETLPDGLSAAVESTHNVTVDGQKITWDIITEGEPPSPCVAENLTLTYQITAADGTTPADGTYGPITGHLDYTAFDPGEEIPGSIRVETGPSQVEISCAALNYEIDGVGGVNAATDGMLMLRYLYGFRGSALISGAVGEGCTGDCSSAQIEAKLASLLNGNDLDVDDDKRSDALTDGLLLLRYLHGRRDSDLITGAVAAGCDRCLATEIQSFIADRIPD